MNFKEDIEIAKIKLQHIPTDWDGKKSILEMKDADYNWRQMEWWGFYFEMLCKKYLSPEFEVLGEKISIVRDGGRKTNMTFDLKRTINWDVKAKAIKSDEHKAILNDKASMETSIAKYGEHGLIIGLCDVEYNDINRAFQKWHEELKGGKSKYELDRIQRTNVSRYRKTHVVLTEILFLIVTEKNIEFLDTYKQGRNSDGTARPSKYMIDLEYADKFLEDRILFAK
jgi:hypothetical protein